MAPLSGARILLSAHCDDHCKILFGIIPSLIEDIQTLFPFIFVVYRVISRRRRSPVGIFFFFFHLRHALVHSFPNPTSWCSIPRTSFSTPIIIESVDPPFNVTVRNISPYSNYPGPGQLLLRLSALVRPPHIRHLKAMHHNTHLKSLNPTISRKFPRI